MPTRSDVVQAYWDHHRLSGGVRAERLAADELFWACEQVREAMAGPLHRALAVLDALLAHPDADVLVVGAGPLEELLIRTDLQVDDAVAGRCRRSSPWRQAASGVWLDEAELRRVPAMAPFLTACPI